MLKWNKAVAISIFMVLGVALAAGTTTFTQENNIDTFLEGGGSQIDDNGDILVWQDTNSSDQTQRNLFVYRTDTYQQIYKEDISDSDPAIDVSSDGKYIAVVRSGATLLYQVDNFNVTKLPEISRGADSVSISKDNSKIAILGSSGTAVYNLSDRTQLFTTSAGNNDGSLKWGKNSNLLAVPEQDQITIFNSSNNYNEIPESPITNITGIPSDIVWGSNNKRLVSAASDLKIFNTSNYQVENSLDTSFSNIENTPEVNWLLSGTNGGTTQIYNFPELTSEENITILEDQTHEQVDMATNLLTFRASRVGVYTYQFTENASPIYRNLQDTSTNGGIEENEDITISAEWKDQDSGLTNITLATNTSGSFQNVTGEFGSPVTFDPAKPNEYVDTTFNWEYNSLTAGQTLGYKIYAEDSDGNQNVTETGSVYINTPPSIGEIQVQPVPTTISNNVEIKVNVTDDQNSVQNVTLDLTDADGTLEYNNIVMNDDAAIDEQYSFSFNPDDDPSSVGTWQIDVTATDQYLDTSNRSKQVTIQDDVKPETRNLQDNVGNDVIVEGLTADISAEFRDNESGLGQATLALNNTGSFQNITNQFNSPFDFNGEIAQYETATFNYDTSGDGGTQVGYKVYGEDVAGNTKETGTDSFYVDSPPNVENVQVFNNSLERTGRVEEGVTARIRANISDPDGRSELDTARITITHPNGTQVVTNAFMNDIGDINDGNTYEYSYTPQTGDGNGGEYQVDVTATNIYNNIGTGQASFIHQTTNIIESDPVQEQDQTVYEDISFTKTVSFENPTDSNFENARVEVDIPNDIRESSLQVIDDEGAEVDYSIDSGNNQVNFQVSDIADNSILEYDLEYDVKNLSITENNFIEEDGGARREHFELNFSTRGETNFEDLRAFKDIPNPGQITDASLELDGEDVTQDDAYTFRLVDSDGDGEEDRAVWNVPNIEDLQQWDVIIRRGAPVNITTQTVIENPPVVENKLIEWRKGVRFENSNAFDLLTTTKIRVPLEAENIRVNGEIEAKRFDDLGSYVSASLNVPANSNESVYVTYRTSSVQIDERFTKPEAFYINKETDANINVTFSNPLPNDLTNVETTLNVLDARNLVVKYENGTEKSNRGDVEGNFNVNLSKVAAGEDRKLVVDYEVPVADSSFVGERNISNGNRLHAWSVSSISPVTRNNVRFTTDIDCTFSTSAYIIDNNQSQELRCEDGNTVVELDSLGPNQDFRLGVEESPYRAVTRFTKDAARIVVSNGLIWSIVVAVVLLATLGFIYARNNIFDGGGDVIT